MNQLLGVVLATLSLAGCLVEEKPPTAANGNFVLYVSNQSFEIDPVDIRVTIDGEAAVDDVFEVRNQHNWVEYTFRLAKGRHTLRVESRRGEAELERTFELRGKRWAVLDYWYYRGEPKHFSFDISARPIGFA